MLAFIFWDADCPAPLLQIYLAMVRSKLEYGSIVYFSARPSALKHLDPLQNQGLHLCTSDFHTSPASSLAVFAQEPPLALRRQQLTLLYASRMASMLQQPNFHPAFHPRYRWLFARYSSHLLSLVCACSSYCSPLASLSGVLLCTILGPFPLDACGSFHSFPHFSWS